MVVQNLKEKLSYLGLAISKENTALPKTKMVRFSKIGDIVYAYTYDGINNIRVEIGTSTKPFEAIVEYNLLNNFVKLCEGDVELTFTDNALTVKASNTKCKIPTYNNQTKSSDAGIPSPDNKYTYDKSLTEDMKLSLLKTVLDPKHVVEDYQKIYFDKNVMVSDTDNVLLVESTIFDKNFLLNLSSAEILNNITNCKYTYDGNKLCISSDELIATMIIYDVKDFQYEELLELFNYINTTYTTIESKALSKAITASQIFKLNPILEFNEKGVFLKITSVSFIYKISDNSCEKHSFEVDSNIIKKMMTIGDELKVYYTSQDVIKCVCDNVSLIVSAKEILDVS